MMMFVNFPHRNKLQCNLNKNLKHSLQEEKHLKMFSATYGNHLVKALRPDYNDSRSIKAFGDNIYECIIVILCIFFLDLEKDRVQSSHEHSSSRMAPSQVHLQIPKVT